LRKEDQTMECDYCGKPIEDGGNFRSPLDPERRNYCSPGCLMDGRNGVPRPPPQEKQEPIPARTVDVRVTEDDQLHMTIRLGKNQRIMVGRYKNGDAWIRTAGKEEGA